MRRTITDYKAAISKASKNVSVFPIHYKTEDGIEISVRSVNQVMGHDDSIPYNARLCVNGETVGNIWNDGWGGMSQIDIKALCVDKFRKAELSVALDENLKKNHDMIFKSMSEGKKFFEEPKPGIFSSSDIRDLADELAFNAMRLNDLLGVARLYPKSRKGYIVFNFKVGRAVFYPVKTLTDCERLYSLIQSGSLYAFNIEDIRKTVPHYLN